MLVKAFKKLLKIANSNVGNIYARLKMKMKLEPLKGVWIPPRDEHIRRFFIYFMFRLKLLIWTFIRNHLSEIKCLKVKL